MFMHRITTFIRNFFFRTVDEKPYSAGQYDFDTVIWRVMMLEHRDDSGGVDIQHAAITLVGDIARTQLQYDEPGDKGMYHVTLPPRSKPRRKPRSNR